MDVIRTDKPDVMFTTYLDVDGQHGHHRAIAEITEIAVRLSADPGYPGSPLLPWQVGKYYIPAKSGSDGVYDDAESPPTATLVVRTDAIDPVTGWSWNQVGEACRRFHKTQRMGYALPINDRSVWPLHLKASYVQERDSTMASGLLCNASALAATTEDDVLRALLNVADLRIMQIGDSLEDAADLLSKCRAAQVAVGKAIDRSATLAGRDFLHRLERKQCQLDHVMSIALSCDLHVLQSKRWLRVGQATGVDILKAETIQDMEVTIDLPPFWHVEDDIMTVDEGASPHDPFPMSFDPLEVQLPRVSAIYPGKDATSKIVLPLNSPPLVLPHPFVELDHNDFVINTAFQNRSIRARFGNELSTNSSLGIALPSGWQFSFDRQFLKVMAPEDVAEGLYQFELFLNGARALLVERLEYDFLEPTYVSTEATIRILVIRAEMACSRVGYLGGGSDNLDHWLAQMGVMVKKITTADELLGTLDHISTLVIGTFAFGNVDGITKTVPQLRNWIERGGNLITFIHRPWDNWTKDVMHVFPVRIGQPAVRWRVTNPSAKIWSELPIHQLLNYPNKIENSDWEHWKKERGVYFAEEWAPMYDAPLTVEDPDQNYRGSLLVGQFGNGRHVHVALSLPYQLDQLIPGAFRILANVISQRRVE